jgi:polyhydroxybutyrate depolymerase
MPAVKKARMQAPTLMHRLFCTSCLLIVLAAAALGPARAESLIVSGHERTFLVYRPPALSRANLVPLVIVLHGGFGSGLQAKRSYHWDDEADRNGFVVVYPDGFRRSWNAGGLCCGPAFRNDVDDIGFITRLIEATLHTENIDHKRVYLAGISNGAALAYRYACEGPYPIAAIGSVSGGTSVSCPRPHPVSAMEIHGLDDRNIPFMGGIGSKAFAQVPWLPVERTLGAFRRANHCNVPSSRESGPVRTEASRCAQGRDVVLIAIAGAGHQWPGARPHRGIVASLILRLDPPSTALDATSVLWDFFRSHPAN